MKKLLLITAAIAAFMLFCVKDVNAQNIDTTRSKAFGYAWTQAELDSFPQKTNLPTIYLQIYKTTVNDDGTNVTTTFTDGSLEELGTIFNLKNSWYYITKVTVRDDNGTIKERRDWAGVRGRGNSTWNIGYGNYKRPLRIKFLTKTPLLTTQVNGAEVNNYANEKSWTLLANSLDATLIRNGMTAEVSKYLGLEFTPAAVYADLVVNGKYMGNYQISDQVQVGQKRVPVIENVGYFFEFNSDKGQVMKEDPYFNLSNDGFGWDSYVNVKSPEADLQTIDGQTKDPKFDKLRSHIVKVAKLAQNGPYNTTASWRKYVDIESAVNAFITEDIAGNYDGVVANNYAYMPDIYSKIFFGPIWDTDLAWGCLTNGNDMTEKHLWEGESHAFGEVVKKLYENDPYFVKALYERWREVYNNGELITYLTGKVDELKERIKVSAALNYDTGVNGAGHYVQKDSWADSNSYGKLEDAYDVMKTFITNHITWLNNDYEAKYYELSCQALPELVDEGEGGGGEDNPTGLVHEGLNAFWGYGEDTYYYYGSKNIIKEGATLTITLTGGTNFQMWTNNANKLYDANSSGWTYSNEDSQFIYSRNLTSEDVEAIKNNGYVFAIVMWNAECTSLTIEGGESGGGEDNPDCTHDYADCNFEPLGDGTYRRVCNICSTPELEGEPYYQFIIYPENDTELTMMGTTWRPEDLGTDTQGNALYPNAIAKVKVTADVAANIKDGVNIVNVTGEQVCQNLVITDGHPYYCDKKFTAIKSTYSRKMKNDWGTIILPYKYQQASNETASFYHLSAVNESADGRITLLLMPINPDIDGDASAYTPVFVKRKGNAEAITVDGENITVKKSTADKSSSTVADWTLYGAIEQTETVTDEYAYYVANNTFYQNDGSFQVNPFRAYIKYSGLDLPAKTIGITADGDEDIASSLQTVSTDDCLAIFIDNGQISVGAPADMNVAITTLGGARVKSANMAKGSTITVSVPAGIYLVNGVKVLVK
ncbi:MAG: CotH kinase family protein [Bacteroidaceae bacterium]|nr:CotH kinase family protein [Bacteroidaceae bacterium]